MNARIYDAAMISGTACCASGAWLLAGAGAALVTAGALIIGLTLIGALLTKAD